MATPELTRETTTEVGTEAAADVTAVTLRPSRRLVAILVTTAFDVAACVLLLVRRHEASAASEFLLLRGLLGVITYGGWRMTASAGESLQSAAASILMVTTLPVLGGTLLGLACSPLATRSQQEEEPRTLTWASPLRWDNPGYKPRAPAHRDGAGAIAAILADTSTTPPELRLHALMRLRPLPRRIQVLLARRALSDPSDEIRLFAFSMIDKLRSTHERQLDKAQAALSSALSPSATARAHLQLAETLWESVYHGLYEDAAQRDLCDDTLRHIEAAQELAPLAASAELLRGRVLLLRREDSAADAAFRQALALGCPPTRVLPYQAECAFRRRDFGQLRGLLATLRRSEAGVGAAHLPSSFTPVMDHWL